MSLTPIAVDRNLREILSALARTLLRTEEVPLEGGTVYEQRDCTIRSAGGAHFTVERSFAGYDWRFGVHLDDLKGLISGEVREWPMERLQKSTAEEAPLTDDAVEKILGSLGFSPKPTDLDSDEDIDDDETATKQGERPLTGLEEGIEGEADFGSVTESDLDAFLNAYDEATAAPKPKPSDEAPAEKSDPLSALLGDLLNADDEEFDDEGDDSEGVDPVALESANSFITLLVSNEKLELTDDADPIVLAEGLAPLLEEEIRASKKADLVMDWLLDQDSVEDVFLTDEEMISLLRQW